MHEASLLISNQSFKPWLAESSMDSVIVTEPKDLKNSLQKASMKIEKKLSV